MKSLLPFLACCCAVAPAAAAIPAPGGLAPALRASNLEEAAFMLGASGVHVYECRALADGRYAWAFLNPDATLYDGTRSIGTQTSPNAWESSSDRSSVSGLVRATQPAGVDNLPWALVAARSDSSTGLFSGVTSVQRVNTSGGVAPREGCTDTSVGTEARVAFTADYYFYKRRGAS